MKTNKKSHMDFPCKKNQTQKQQSPEGPSQRGGSVVRTTTHERTLENQSTSPLRPSLSSRRSKFCELSLNSKARNTQKRAKEREIRVETRENGVYARSQLRRPRLFLQLVPLQARRPLQGPIVFSFCLFDSNS